VQIFRQPEPGVKTNLLDPQAMVKDHLRISSQMSPEGFATRTGLGRVTDSFASRMDVDRAAGHRAPS
jgi:hypothetical protein